MIAHERHHSNLPRTVGLGVCQLVQGGVSYLFGISHGVLQFCKLRGVVLLRLLQAVVCSDIVL